ncbi:unnamed protein product [Calypogeia fissa]
MVAADREALEETLLGDLKDTDEIEDSGEWASKHSLDHGVVCDVIRSLKGFQFIDSKEIKRVLWTLTEEGKSVVELGSPEVRLFSAVPAEGNISQIDLQTIFADIWNFGSKHAFKAFCGSLLDTLVEARPPLRHIWLGKRPLIDRQEQFCRRSSKWSSRRLVHHGGYG